MVNKSGGETVSESSTGGLFFPAAVSFSNLQVFPYKYEKSS
jgi:hypothetical protein